MNIGWLKNISLVSLGSVLAFSLNLGFNFFSNKQQLQISTLEKKMQLHKQMEELYPEIFMLRQEIDRANDNRAAAGSIETSRLAGDVSAIATAKMEQKKELFRFYEQELAKLEERPARDVKLDFSRPAAPTAISIGIK